MRIPRYKTPIIILRADSEISDGTIPVCADSEARAKRFMPKRKLFPDRADKFLYFPSLTYGREDSDASRRSITWDIEIYNRIKQIEMKHRIVRVRDVGSTMSDNVFRFQKS